MSGPSIQEKINIHVKTDSRICSLCFKEPPHIETNFLCKHDLMTNQVITAIIVIFLVIVINNCVLLRRFYHYDVRLSRENTLIFFGVN